MAFAWTWIGPAQTTGVAQARAAAQQIRTHALAYGGGQPAQGPTAQQLNALALEVVNGGRQAHRQVAQALQVDPALVEEWTTTWAQAAHERHWGGGMRRYRRHSESSGQ